MKRKSESEAKKSKTIRLSAQNKKEVSFWSHFYA